MNCPSPLTAEEDACIMELCNILPSPPPTHSNNQEDVQRFFERNGGAKSLSPLTVEGILLDELEQALPTFSRKRPAEEPCHWNGKRQRNEYG